jgi:hypothetical protein
VGRLGHRDANSAQGGGRGGAGRNWEPAGPRLRAGPRERGLGWVRGWEGARSSWAAGRRPKRGERGEFPSFIYFSYFPIIYFPLTFY